MPPKRKKSQAGASAARKKSLMTAEEARVATENARAVRQDEWYSQAKKRTVEDVERAIKNGHYSAEILLWNYNIGDFQVMLSNLTAWITQEFDGFKVDPLDRNGGAILKLRWEREDEENEED
mgnify:CR=1 FL=1